MKEKDRRLVIVESPAKARTLGRMLGTGYQVRASLGHVRDLPKSQLGVDVDNGFAPKYLIPKEKKAVVKELQEAAKGASSVYLATDPDREGEAISWHLVEAIQLDRLPVRRVVFHEFTQAAIDQAFHHPRAIDMRLVNAQQARRILDRLVGYKLSPLLWKKVRRGLSAGRVQSVTLRMIVDREREIQGFVPVEFWSIEAELARAAEAPSFRARLVGLADGTKLDIPDPEEATRLVAELEPADYRVAQVRRRQTPRRPAPPFITSTLQQEAWHKLHFTAEHTMAVAQQLYEGLPVAEEGVVGLITYMRTDSTRVASPALAEARDYIKEKYGADFLPLKPRVFTSKVKGAQEAHEAIRPTSVRREPALVRPNLSQDQYKLYDLIWKRLLASQMSPALLDTTTVEVEARNPESGRCYLFKATSSQVKFPGFLIVYSESSDDTGGEEEGGKPLPELAKGDLLKLLGLFPEQHFTQPPPRYSEATLIKALEENGIGRPSTYAPTLSTIRQRGYVRRVAGRFQPEELGFIVADLLSQHFPDIIDVGFTAKMEEELDEIARGEQEWVPLLQGFYTPFEGSLQRAAQIDKVKIADEPTGELCPQCSKPMVIKLGRFGKFIACSGYPECKTTHPLLVKIGVACPECGGDLVERRSRKKRTFYGCANYPRCRFSLGQRPLAQACPGCGGLMIQRGRKRAKCTGCGRIEELAQRETMVGA